VCDSNVNIISFHSFIVWFYVWAHNTSALITVECAIELAGFGVALTTPSSTSSFDVETSYDSSTGHTTQAIDIMTRDQSMYSKTYTEARPWVQAFPSSEYRVHSAPSTSPWLRRWTMSGTSQTIEDADDNLQEWELQCQKTKLLWYINEDPCSGCTTCPSFFIF